MKMLPRALFTSAAILLFAPYAHAQVASAVVASACGTPPQTYTAGTIQPQTQDTTGTLCTAGGGGGTSNVVILPTTSSSAAPTGYSSGAAESNHVVKASAGNLYLVYAFSTVAGLIMTFNSTTVPSDGAVTPIECIPVTANNFSAHDLRDIPSNYATGISVAFSTGTNCFNKTASATAFFRIEYK